MMANASKTPDGRRASRRPILWGAIGLALSCAFTSGGLQAAELVMYEAVGCPYCKQWLTEVGPGYPASEQGRRAPLVRQMIKDPPRPGVTLAAPIAIVPTFVVIEQGKEVGRLTGFIGTEFFYPIPCSMKYWRACRTRRNRSTFGSNQN